MHIGVRDRRSRQGKPRNCGSARKESNRKKNLSVLKYKEKGSSVWENYGCGENLLEFVFDSNLSPNPIRPNGGGRKLREKMY